MISKNPIENKNKIVFVVLYGQEYDMNFIMVTYSTPDLHLSVYIQTSCCLYKHMAPFI